MDMSTPAPKSRPKIKYRPMLPPRSITLAAWSNGIMAAILAVFMVSLTIREYVLNGAEWEFYFYLDLTAITAFGATIATVGGVRSAKGLIDSDYFLTPWHSSFIADNLDKGAGAICPDCKKGKLLQGSRSDVGANAGCPDCGSEFTLVIWLQPGSDMAMLTGHRIGPRSPGTLEPHRRKLYHGPFDPGLLDPLSHLWFDRWWDEHGSGAGARCETLKEIAYRAWLAAGGPGSWPRSNNSVEKV
jgi:Zn ribbon nucleic-acid-binding protein